ncbi:MAG: hypothetical protein LAO51_18220 [Acidobacteriia bacterium]|nr:hypothetical protein [Terriglobia bacterium]
MTKSTLPMLLLASLILPAPARATAPQVLPFAEVRAGMKGTGRTVFSGTGIEEFEVEILGTLPNIGPGQNLILGKLSGGPLASTGVLAGMSGSPVFVDGKLIGAVAYSWGFSKEPIAGITPIEEMLAAAARGEGAAGGTKAGAALDRAALRRLLSPEAAAAFFPEGILARLPRPASGSPVPVPLSVAGIGVPGIDRIAPFLSRAGFSPMQGGGGGRAPAPSPPLAPGSAVGIKLCRGDLDITATGTVTWVDGERVMAFGHPLLGLGPVDMPLTGARAEVLLPSLQESARMATPLSEIGAFRQDRVSGIFGTIGAAPRMIPVRLELRSRGGSTETFSFDMARDPLLAPLILYAGLNAILANEERVSGNITLRIGEGSVIKLDGLDDVELDNLYAGPTASFLATGIPAYILYLLLNGDWVPPRVEGINLILDYDAEPHSGRIRRVGLDRYTARPGEKVEVSVVVTPYRGGEQVLKREFEIPPETPPGPLQLFVGDAGGLSRVEGAGESDAMPRDIAQLVKLVNQLRRNDRVYVLGTREDSGVVVDGERLPSLPPSALSILLRPRSRGNFTVVQRRALLEEEIPCDFDVDGLARVQLDVEAP